MGMPISSKYEIKDENDRMVMINKQEKDVIVEHFPFVHIVRTMRGDSRRHHYYMEEAPGAMRMLRRLRGEEVKQRRKGRGRNYTGTENRRNRT